MTRLNAETEKEIRDRLRAFKHYPIRNQTPSSYEESHGPDMEELLEEIDALRGENDKLRSKLGAAEMIIDDLNNITIPKLMAKIRGERE